MRAAHGLDDAVDHLGRVRARLALEPRDERDLVEVAVVHPLDDDLSASSSGTPSCSSASTR